jgi:hypothetical protein
MRRSHRKRDRRTKPKCVTCCGPKPGQEALKTARVDYAKVDKAISQLSDDDLATVAEKFRQADHDFAAGGLSQRLIVIVLIIILTVVLSLVF